MSTSLSPELDDDYILDIINPRDNFIFDNDIQSIKSSEDLVFAVDTFSNLVGHDEDDEKYDEDIIGDNYEECYTHTILLLGRCVIFCKNQVVRFCAF